MAGCTLDVGGAGSVERDPRVPMVGGGGDGCHGGSVAATQPVGACLRVHVHARIVYLGTLQPSRDPSTGWRCHPTGAGGASQYYDPCYAENPLGYTSHPGM